MTPARDPHAVTFSRPACGARAIKPAPPAVRAPLKPADESRRGRDESAGTIPRKAGDAANPERNRER